MSEEQGVELVEDEVESVDTEPQLGDAEWHDWVMQQFTDDELDSGHPKVHGLRRLVTALLGTIITSRPGPPVVMQTENGLKVFVNYELEVDFGKGDVRQFGALADADKSNSDKPYDKFPGAIADTRAEGRALRRALQLNIASAEELVKGDNTVAETEGPIATEQVNLINMLAKRLNVNVQKLVESKGLSLKDKLTYDNGAKLNKELSDYQKDASVIDKNLLGYDPNWRDELNDSNNKK